ncbi:MAG: regulatory protein GemA [Candidatus Riflebacteria bacterium]|nr:regulatory protein GemA [Candidatus Riflebacteria bacterium]
MEDKRRKNDLAMIHIAKVELGLDDDLYHCFLKQVCGVESASELDEKGRRLFIKALRDKGALKKYKNAGKPHNFDEVSRKRLMSKIEALLAEAGRPWSYADALAKRICKVDRLAFVRVEDLYKIITPLVRDARKHGGVS